MRPKLTILGCGWHSHVVAELAELCGHYSCIELLDRDWPVREVWGDWKVVGGFQAIEKDLSASSGRFVVALGDNHLRVTLCQKILQNGGTLVTLVHPSAFVSSRAKLGEGTVVCAGVVIQPYVTTGIACIVNTSASIDHHCQLADGVHLSPGVHLSGNVSVGSNTWVGTGVSVKDKINVGDDITVGVGSVVVKDICHPGIYAGVPSRLIRSFVDVNPAIFAKD